MNMKGIVKDAMMLFLITLIAGALLGAVHEVTLEPIAKAQQEAANATYREVFPEASNFVTTDALTAAVADSADEIAAQGFGSVSVDAAMEAQDESGNVIGYMITATSGEGYGGDVQISVNRRRRQSDRRWFPVNQRDSRSGHEGPGAGVQRSVCGQAHGGDVCGD